MASPTNDRFFLRIVILEIVAWDLDLQSLLLISEILVFQGVRCIFGVAGDEELTAVSALYDVNARLIRFGDDFQSWNLFDIRSSHLCVATVWRIEDVVKSSENRILRVQHFVFEHTKLLLA